MQLSETFHLIFVASMYVIPLVGYLILILLTTFTPRTVMERYVRPPHFTEFEALAYRHFPSSWIRTLLFSVAISIPFFRRFRNFGPIHQNVPLWFNLACRFFVYVVLGSATLVVTMLALMVSFPDFFK